MKVYEDKPKPGDIPFADLNISGTFQLGQWYYMKIFSTSGFNAVNLETGCCSNFADTVVIEPINKLVIERVE